MLRGIIFDLGNTLMVFNGEEQAAIQAGAAAMADWYLHKKHISLEREALITTFIQVRRQNYALALQDSHEITAEESLAQALQAIHAPKTATACLSEAIRIFFEPEEAQYQPCEEATSLLSFLKEKGLRVGLFSNATDDPLIQRLVNRLGFRPYLSPVFSSAGVGWRKPHPYGLQLIAERWAISPSSIAMVGDMPGTDILGAQQAGMHSILFSLSGQHAAESQPEIAADVRIIELAMIKDLINQW
jgi:HAD superfamily hydrolase (TIGR01549 family)